MTVKLAFCSDPWGFRREAQALDLRHLAIVHHARRVLHRLDHAPAHHLAVDVDRIAFDAEHRDERAGELLTLDHAQAIEAEPFHLAFRRIAVAGNAHAARRQDFLDCFQFEQLALAVAVQLRAVLGELRAVLPPYLVQLLVFLADAEILGEADVFLILPLKPGAVAGNVFPVRVLGVRIAAPILLALHLHGNDAPHLIAAVRHDRCRVHVDRKQIANRKDSYVLLERCRADVLRDHAEKAPSRRQRLSRSGVIGNGRLRTGLDVPADAVDDLGDFDVRAFADRVTLAARSLLADVVLHPLDECIGQVDRQFRRVFAGGGGDIVVPLVALTEQQAALGLLAVVRLALRADAQAVFALFPDRALRDGGELPI